MEKLYGHELVILDGYEMNLGSPVLEALDTLAWEVLGILGTALPPDIPVSWALDNLHDQNKLHLDNS